MGFFKKIVQAGIDVALVPVAVVKDVVTMGGVVTGKPHSYTKEKVDTAIEHAQEAYESLDD